MTGGNSYASRLERLIDGLRGLHTMEDQPATVVAPNN